MTKTINIQVTIDGLPEEADYSRLRVELKREVNDAAVMAIDTCFKDGMTGKEVEVDVHAF